MDFIYFGLRFPLRDAWREVVDDDVYCGVVLYDDVSGELTAHPETNVVAWCDGSEASMRCVMAR